MGRRELREHIFKLLFMGIFNSREEMPEQLSLYFEDFGEMAWEDHRYIEEKYYCIADHLDDLDAIINQSAKGWKTSRMSRVDLTILRLAVYEVVYDDDIPVRVAINEAVELAKKFGQDESAGFVNGILGTIARKQEA